MLAAPALHLEESTVTLYSTSHVKINSRWIISPNAKIKILDTNWGIIYKVVKKPLKFPLRSLKSHQLKTIIVLCRQTQASGTERHYKQIKGKWQNAPCKWPVYIIVCKSAMIKKTTNPGKGWLRTSAGTFRKMRMRGNILNLADIRRKTC